MRRSFVAIAGLLLLAGCASSADPESSSTEKIETFLLQGSVLVPVDFQLLSKLGNSDPQVGDYCTSAFGYEDISSKTQVIVADEAGTTIASGRIPDGGGTIVVGGGALTDQNCEFRFNIYNVPSSAKFYEIRIGSSTTDTYTRSQAIAGVEFDLR